MIYKKQVVKSFNKFDVVSKSCCRIGNELLEVKNVILWEKCFCGKNIVVKIKVFVVKKC